MTDSENPNALTDDELTSAVELTDADIRDRSQALHDTQELWEKTAYLAEAKMPCRECGATGRVGREICPGCMGSRVELAPDADEFPMPDFAAMRRAIGAYGDALEDRKLPDGHMGKRQLALPPAATVPTMDAISRLRDEGKAKLKELRQLTDGAAHGRGVDVRQLPEGKAPTGSLEADDADLGEIEDAELDGLEDAANKPRGKR